MRGEHVHSCVPMPLLGGSAPRARGTRLARQHAAQRRRISPACAGNTHRRSCSRTSRSDQPRVRGEHRPVWPLSPPAPGSAPRARGTRRVNGRREPIHRISACRGTRGVIDPEGGAHGSAPRARGTPVPSRCRGVCDRISPACAGNTPQAATWIRCRPDQPRVRGEHARLHDSPLPRCGSAPRARGTPAIRTAHVRRPRISPACAGNTRPKTT